MRVLRIFHAGRNPAHRVRDRELIRAGIEVVYAVPSAWPEAGSEARLSAEPFPILEVAVRRPGDINRHSYIAPDSVARLATDHAVDLVDLFEEPFSRAAAQLLPRLPERLPVVMYSAQNLDKRWPPPFGQWERRAFRRVQGFYPCSRQAAAVLRGHGYAGLIEPLALGFDAERFHDGHQQLVPGGEIRLLLVGRMVAEKGVSDSVQVLAALHRRGLTRVQLTLAGRGPALDSALAEASELGVRDHVTHIEWLDSAALAEQYRSSHIVLAPSRSTSTWVEQFGRMLVEAQASGCVVAGYRSGSIPEVAGDAAALVGEGAVAELADAVEAVVGDPDRFDRLRRAGLERTATMTWPEVASAQAAFYRRAATQPARPLLPGTPRAWRRAATAEFGSPATAGGQTRPFALPVLREPTPMAAALGAALDTVAELRARAAAYADRRRASTRS